MPVLGPVPDIVRQVDAWSGRRPILGLRRVVALALVFACLFGFGYLGGVRFVPAETIPPAPGAVPEASEVRTILPEASGPGPYELLLRCQRPSGAITTRPGGDRIVPYFANIAALALVERRPGDVKAYMEWYLAHLNRPDRWGLHGTVYDYRVTADGREVPTGTYDSADSYAATFLALLRVYLDHTGDRGFVMEHLPEIELVASVITGLQDSDGLVWATPARVEKYLMDNCENFRGLVDYAAVLSSVGREPEARAVREAAGRILAGVQGRLWNPKRGNYDWAIYTLRLGGLRIGEVSRKSSWSRWYPDSVAQVFPVISGVLEPGDPRAAALYQNLNEWHPGWVHQTKDDPHPWSVLGYAAALMGDHERAFTFVRSTAHAYMAREGPFSELSWELAYHLLTLRLLRGKEVPAAEGPDAVPDIDAFRREDVEPEAEPERASPDRPSSR
ncbi:MAG TPA: hypothetical protein DGR79_01395 [Clostridiales bacterium]|nr:hypothetical protein [Clostridiales bacterium]